MRPHLAAVSLIAHNSNGLLIRNAAKLCFPANDLLLVGIYWRAREKRKELLEPKQRAT